MPRASRVEGAHPIENYGVIGDMRSIALVSVEGSIDFLSYPDFDSPTIFAALLDPERGGSFAPQGKAAATPEEGWPDNTYSIEQKRLYFNDEPVVIMHQTANSDGNSMVLFRKSDVVSVGSMLDLTQYPMIDTEHGGSIPGKTGGGKAFAESGRNAGKLNPR